MHPGTIFLRWERILKGQDTWVIEVSIQQQGRPPAPLRYMPCLLENNWIA